MRGSRSQPSSSKTSGPRRSSPGHGLHLSRDPSGGGFECSISDGSQSPRRQETRRDLSWAQPLTGWKKVVGCTNGPALEGSKVTGVRAAIPEHCGEAAAPLSIDLVTESPLGATDFATVASAILEPVPAHPVQFLPAPDEFAVGRALHFPS